VVRDGFVVDQRALGKVGGGYNDAAGALAVRSASDVVSCGGRLKCWNGFDGHWRLGQQGEELGKFGLHLLDVMRKSSSICSAEVGAYFLLVFSEARNAARSAKPSFFRDGGHFFFYAVYLAKSQLMNLIGDMRVVVRA